MIAVSEHIILRPLRYSDATSITKHANNFNVWKNLTDLFPYPYSIDDALQFISSQKFKQQPEAFAIVYKDAAIGAIRYSIIKRDEYICADIGYWIGETYWNKGIVTKVIKALCKYGFSAHKQLDCFSAFVFTTNTASKKALEKAGFKQEKTYSKSMVKAGKKMDVHYYVKFRKGK